MDDRRIRPAGMSWGQALKGALSSLLLREFFGLGLPLATVVAATLLEVLTDLKGFGILAAVCAAAFAGGYWAEIRAIRRSSRLFHRLAEQAAERTDDEPVPEWWLHREVLNPGHVSVQGTVIEKRYAPSGALILSVQTKDRALGTCQILCSERYEQRCGEVNQGDNFSLTGKVHGIVGSRLCVRDPSMDGD